MPLDFRHRAPFDHLWRWSGDVTLPGPGGRYGLVVTGSAELVLPVPHPALAGVVLEWELLSTDKSPGVRVPVSVWEGDRLLASAELPADRSLVHLAMLLPPAPDRDTRTIRLVVEPQPHSRYRDSADVVAEIYQAVVHRTPAAWPVRIDIGGPGDDLHILSGFHPAEGRGASAYRWTSGPAEVAVYLPGSAPAPDSPVALRVLWSAESIPAGVPGAGTLRVSWDGTPLDGRIAPAPEAPGRLLWEGTVPPTLLSPLASHRITLDAPVWHPSDYGSRDSRPLGARIFQLDLAPVPAP